MKPISSRGRQAGITLLVTLVMLVLLTLFVLAGIRLSNINLRITGNFQWQKQMELIADSAIEQLVSTTATFEDAAVQAGTAVDKDICADGSVVAVGGCNIATNPKVVTVTQPRCTASRTATGYSKKLGELVPDDNDWVIRAVASDSVSGAKVTIYRGITVRMLANHCPE